MFSRQNAFFQGSDDLKILNRSKIEILIFAFFLYAQSFALLNFGGFGFSALLVLLFFQFVSHKLFKKMNPMFFVFLILLSAGALGTVLFSENPNWLQFGRWLMIVFILYSSVSLFSLAFQTDERQFLARTLILMTFVFCFYGFYQFIANYLNLPYFLQFLRNNHSYFRSAYNDYYGGWVSIGRIYTLFVEPSFYAMFLFLMLILLLYSDFKKWTKIVFALVFLLNLMLTFSRSGIVYIALLALVLLFLPLLGKIRKAAVFLILMLPMMIPLAMKLADRYIFNDLSSSARTESAIYYFKASFDENLIFGHGFGSVEEEYESLVLSAVSSDSESTRVVEAEELLILSNVEIKPHNGYIHLLFENGLFGLLSVLFFSYLAIGSIRDNKTAVLAALAVSSLFTFEIFFHVESVLVLVVFLFFYLKEKDFPRWKMQGGRQ